MYLVLKGFLDRVTSFVSIVFLAPLLILILILIVVIDKEKPLFRKYVLVIKKENFI